MNQQPNGEKPSDPRRKVTLLQLQRKKELSQPITMLTAYDYPSALLVDRAEFDIILVGDSLAMVVLGLNSTVSVTMDEMLHHCRAVARGADYAFLVGDMPFMSYQADIGKAVWNAGRFLKEGGMDSVKVEGGEEMAGTVRAIVDAGIPVMGHLGLTPQSSSKLGGFRVQARQASAARKLLADAQALEDAGCYSLVLEAIPAPVARVVSSKLTIPTIGIGAGPGCDGQVLVYHDLLGLFDRFTPKFVRRYASLGELTVEALRAFADDIVNGRFPAEEHTYAMDEVELQSFLDGTGVNR